MNESTKKAFACWIFGSVTPERLFWLFFILLGTTVSTAWNLSKASNTIHMSTMANIAANAAQDGQIKELDRTVDAIRLNVNTLNVNHAGMVMTMNEIKQMIRDIGR